MQDGHVEDQESLPKRVKLEQPSPSPRRPKRKCIVLLGYCGTGYGGMQLNPHVETIELTLFEALVQVGAISAENANDPAKSGWMRSARTDKGVHAALNLVTCKLLERPDGDMMGWVKELNPILEGKKVQIWAIQRVMASFHARMDCSSRIYEYLCPTHVFLPPNPKSAMGKMLAEKDARVHAFWAELHQDEDAEMSSKTTPFQKETARKRAYRLGSGELETIKNLAQAYVGSHNFHNHTSGKDFGDPTARRTIHRIDISEPFVEDGQQEWISIKIHGQSFILHQIRKMIGLLILAARSGSPPALLRASYGKEKIHVPKAPGLGLLLQELFFDGYDQKLKRVAREQSRLNEKGDSVPDERKSIGVAPDQRACIDDFKARHIHRNIFADDVREDVFANWVNFHDVMAGPQFDYLGPEGVIPPSAVLTHAPKAGKRDKDEDE